MSNKGQKSLLLIYVMVIRSIARTPQNIAGSTIGQPRLRDASALPDVGMLRMISDLPLEGLHVLIVEDEAFLAFELVDDLETAGAVSLGPIATVERALRFIRTAERIDAALLNVMLHREVSFPVADELRRRGIPFVFVTGNDQTVRERFPDVPVHPKPADMAKIVLTLASVVAVQARLG